MNDQERRHHANELAEGFTRAAIALAHVDRRRTTDDGIHEGDDMSPIDRMRFAFVGQPRAARYDGDSESTPAREPRCTCGHTEGQHFAPPLGAGMAPTTPCRMGACACDYYEPDTVRGLNSDPTGTAGIRPDKAAQELRDHDKDVRAAEALLERITARLARFGPARPAGDAERALLARENLAPEPGCSNCADPKNGGHWQAVFRGGICDFCYRWTKDVGELPGRRECDLHADGKHARRPDKNHINRRGSAA